MCAIKKKRSIKGRPFIVPPRTSSGRRIYSVCGRFITYVLWMADMDGDATHKNYNVRPVNFHTGLVEEWNRTSCKDVEGTWKRRGFAEWGYAYHFTWFWFQLYLYVKTTNAQFVRNTPLMNKNYSIYVWIHRVPYDLYLDF